MSAMFIDTLEAARRIGYAVDANDPQSVRRARDAFRAFARRKGITLLNRGRRLIVDWLDVEAALKRREVA